jgi:FAD/FMN-containing dehydrogenase
VIVSYGELPMNDIDSDLNPMILRAFRSKLLGTTLVPTDSAYEGARRVWNAAIDRHPSAIITCADAEDVSLAVRIAADNGLALTIRGGGHNVAGRSIRDGVALLDPARRHGRILPVWGRTCARDHPRKFLTSIHFKRI